MKQFKYDLGQKVTLTDSGETGKITGAAVYLNSDPQYRIRYKCADGRLVETWWDEEALESA